VLALSGVYFAVSVSEPVASDPAGIVMDTAPLASGVEDELKLPLERITDPVGAPLAPETVMVTARVCVAFMLEAAGVTVTEGVVGGFPAPLPPLLLPPPQASIEKTTATRERKMSRFTNWFMQTLFEAFLMN